MDKDYIIAIIGVTGTALGTILGFLSSLWYETLKEKIRVKKELQTAINEIIYIGLTNNYPVALNKLRQVIVENQSTLKNKELVNFFQKWLTHPVVENGKPVANQYTDSQRKQLRSELENVKL